MKAIQIQTFKDGEHSELLRLCGVKRIHAGWYTVWYNGVVLDSSTVCKAKRNPKGEIIYDTGRN